MDLGISGKVALVVGGSKGMGRAVCEELAANGARVVVAARSQGPIEEAVAALRAAGGKAAGVAANCVTKEGILKAVAAAEAAFGPPDIAVFNVEAGFMSRFEETVDDDLLRLHNSLVMAFSWLVRAVSPHMKEQRWGRILTVSSSIVKETTRDLPLMLDATYRMASFAFSKGLSNELGPYGITVNTVGPGAVGTEMHRESYERHAKKLGVPPGDILAALQKRIAVGRLGRPDEFGAVCAFLCSDRAGFVTGQVVMVDGGRSLAMA